jgi:predicted O-methyltransferase YrrM
MIISRDDALTRLRLVIDRLIRDGRTVARLDNSDHEIFPVAVSAAEGQSLRDWVIREKVTRTIEIGLAYGLSALFVCEGLLKNGQQNVRHVVVDPYQKGFKNCGLQLLEEAGVSDLVEYHDEESQILLPRLLSQGQTFDLAFVDGSHLFDRVFLDLIYLGRLNFPPINGQ